MREEIRGKYSKTIPELGMSLLHISTGAYVDRERTTNSAHLVCFDMFVGLYRTIPMFSSQHFSIKHGKMIFEIISFDVSLYYPPPPHGFWMVEDCLFVLRKSSQDWKEIKNWGEGGGVM